MEHLPWNSRVQIRKSNGVTNSAGDAILLECYVSFILFWLFKSVTIWRQLVTIIVFCSVFSTGSALTTNIFVPVPHGTLLEQPSGRRVEQNVAHNDICWRGRKSFWNKEKWLASQSPAGLLSKNINQN